jgi:L(+)-tartrate dehydratase beta subunit
MNRKNLRTPLTRADLEDLSIGDVFYLSGIIVTGRDAVHQRVVRQGMKLPLELSGSTGGKPGGSGQPLEGLGLYHAGPIVREGPGGTYQVLAAGPTTSMRMEEAEGEFLAATGAAVIIGKGGMGAKTAAACAAYGAIHAVYPGGCAVLAAAGIEKVETAEWLDLGMAEALWVLRVKDFGPLIVSIDTRGGNLFENNKKIFERKKEEALRAVLPGIAGLY